MTASLGRRAGALTILAATTVALAGCGGVGARLTFNDTEKVKITSIDVAGHSGDVTVSTSPISETRITRVINRGSDPGPTYRIDGTVLHVSTDCGANCDVSYLIEAPVGVAVTGGLASGELALARISTADVAVTSGDITIDGPTGAVKARTTSGTITATGAKGPLTLQATSGDVNAANVVGGPVIVKVVSGTVQLGLATPTSVTAEAQSGDVHVTVPAGSYRVRTRAASGDMHVNGIVDDPAAPNALDLSTGSGNVTVDVAQP